MVHKTVFEGDETCRIIIARNHVRNGLSWGIKESLEIEIDNHISVIII